MKQQTVMWTALPAGRTGSVLQLSVFVSPRLQTDEGRPVPRLEQFPDFLNWHQRTVSFSVELNGGTPLPAKARVRNSRAPQPWPALFSATTFVRPYEFTPADTRLVRSFPLRHVQNFLKQQTVKIGLASPTETPTALALAGPDMLGPIAFEPGHGPSAAIAAAPSITGVTTLNISPQVKQVLDSLESQLKLNKAIPFNYTPDPVRDFLQFKRFFTPVIPAAVLKPPELDFHDALASLSEYPELMRDLGLVIDLDVDITGLTLPASGTVRVLPNWKPAMATAGVSPYTRYRLTPDQFATEARTSDLKQGYLDLAEQEKTDLVLLDVSAGALKALDFANQVTGKVLQGQGSAPAPVPTLRTAGIGVARTGAATKLVSQLTASRLQNDKLTAFIKLTAPPPKPDLPVLYLEDVARGYRVDVWDSATKQWHPLCARVGSYNFADIKYNREYADEGAVSPAVTSDPATGDLFAQENLFHWDGWSLVAPRPNKVIAKDGTVRSREPEGSTPFGLKASFRPAKGSLPRLRFGVTYRFRARAVDLAGNSAPFGSPANTDFTLSSAPGVHARFEPVPAPMVVPRAAMTTGETIDTLVIRSNYNTDALEGCERHIAPPPAAEATLETHGVFDTPTGGPDKAAYGLIAGHDKPFPVDASGAVAAHPEAQLAIPYLPDALARGASLGNLPGWAAPNDPKPYVVGFGPAPRGRWYDLQPFRIRIVEGHGLPAFDPANRVLLIRLPKAEVARVPVSCAVGEQDLPVLGVWRWLEEGASPSRLPSLKQYAVGGQLWQITPPQEITLVHAVQQPLKAPAIDGLLIGRTPGSTYAGLRGTMDLDGKSTGRIDVEAQWSEPIDVPAADGPETIQGKAVVGALESIARTEDIKGLAMRHEFGDTRHRRVQYRAVATTRFKEYFVQPGGTPPALTRESEWQEVHVPSSAPPAVPKVVYVIPTFAWEDRSVRGGLSRARRGGLRIYLDRPWYSSGEGERLGVVVAASPNTQNPYMTRWGGDPIWAAPGASGNPFHADFADAAASVSSVSLLEAGDAVSLALYDVAFDAGRKLWYADVDLRPGAPYMPFVRLALVRYQANAIAGAAVSRVAMADFAQLTPDRTATLGFDAAHPDSVRVTVAGKGPGNPTATKVFGTVGIVPKFLTQGYTGNPITVTVEELPTGATPTADDLRWLPVANAEFFAAPERTDSGDCTWTVDVKLPAARGARPFRLVIREYERIENDATAGQLPTGTGMTVGSGRLVYADALII